MTTRTRRGGRWFKKCQFLSTLKIKNVHVEVGGGQKMAMSPNRKLNPKEHGLFGGIFFGEIRFVFNKFSFTLRSQYSNVSTSPLRQWGFRQWLTFSWTTLRGKHCRHPIAVMGVVDTFEHTEYSQNPCNQRDVRIQLCLYKSFDPIVA